MKTEEQIEEQILNFKGYDKQVIIDWYNQYKNSFPKLLKSGSDFEKQLNRSAFFAHSLITLNKDAFNRLINNPKRKKSLGEPLFYFENGFSVIVIFENEYISVTSWVAENKVTLFSTGMNIDIVDWSILPKIKLGHSIIKISDSGEENDELMIGASFGGTEEILGCVQSFIDCLIDDLKTKRELFLEEGKKNVEKLATLNLEFLTQIKETYDKDGNGIIDISESHNQLELLLKENKKTIQSNHSEHIKDFIKIIAYLKKSQSNLQLLYTELTSDDNLFESTENFKYLETAIDSHQLVSFNSMYLLNSLLDDDLFTFHELREKFDTLRIFNSTYQNDVSQQLKQVNVQLSTVTAQLEVLNSNCLEIVEGLNDLNWATKDMNESLETKLDSINQGVAFSNMTAIYQSNKLRQINNKLS